MPLIRPVSYTQCITLAQSEYIDQLFIDILAVDWLDKKKRNGLIEWALGYKKDLDRLNKFEASKVIEYLKGIKEQKK